MRTLTPPGQLVWAALPHTRSTGEAGDLLHLSVLLSPRLVPDAANQTLAGGPFGALIDWPAAAAGLAFTVEFAETSDTGSTPVSREARLDLSPLDSVAWAALMSGLRVNWYTPTAPALANASCNGYAVRPNYTNLVAGYRPDPSVFPDAVPNGPQLAARAPLDLAQAARQSAYRRLAGLAGANEAERAQVRAELQRLRVQHGAVAARHLSAVGHIAPELLFFEQMNSFYEGLSAGALQRFKDAQQTPPVPPAFDFHAALGAVARYPALMRKLGLVLDLTVPLAPGAGQLPLPANGVVRIRPQQAPAGYATAAPWTAYALDDTSFLAAPDPTNPIGLSAGLIAPLPTDTALGLDLDPLPHGVHAMARTFQAGAAGTAPVMPPAARSAGLSLARDGMQDIVTQLLQRQAAHDAALASADGPGDGSNVTLSAEDLMRGFRVDIRRDGETRWRSLHWRRGRYGLAGGGTLFDAPLDDEGCASLRVFNPDSDKLASSVVWSHETMFRWTGWSLSVPKPGSTVAPKGGLMNGTAGVGSLPDPDASDTPLRVSFAPVPASLPRLRFGSSYRCRLRTVDLAGNGPAADAATDPSLVMPLGPYLRFDPLLAPALLMRDPAQPAESVEHIVLRSTIDAPTTATAERLIAPPRSSVQVAEWHGLFDTETGVDPGLQPLLARLDGDFSETPYGASPPDLPYLPDPIARGVSLRFSMLGPEPVPGPVKLPFDGVWPALQPLRLVVAEGDGLPSWDAATRLFTVPMPKGRRVTVELSSHFDAGQLDLQAGGHDEVKDLALFDYWDNVMSVPKLRQNRLALWQDIVNATNPQLTPIHTLTLVHAVPRPLVAPPLDATMLKVGGADGSTAANLVAITPLDEPSTGQVELMAEWDEPVDDGIHPPYRLSAAAHVGRVSLDYPQAIPTPPTTLSYQQEFHDTRHRRVTYWLVATTRYREQFPEITDTAQLTQVSPKLTIDVPSRASPPPPKVLAVLPMFAWDDAGTPDAPSRRRRTGLRVVLDRPWYASGDGEVLGVVMPIREITEGMIDPGPIPVPGPGPGKTASTLTTSAARETPTVFVKPKPDPGPGDVVLVAEPPTGQINVAIASVVSQWGTDPLFPGASIASAFTPLPQHFANAGALQFLHRMSNDANNSRIWDRVVANFTPTFDPPDPAEPDRPADPQRDAHNGHWVCDLELAAGFAYMPFVRLALVRFQPNGDPGNWLGDMGDPRLSSVVMADFVQLAPDRSASVIGVAGDAGRVSVTLAGPSYADNAATDATARPTPVVTVDTEMDIGDADQPVWVSTGRTELARTPSLQSPGDPATSVWQGQVVLPFTRGTRALRLVLREFECLPTDAADRGDIDATVVNIARRLVYGDVLVL